MSQHELINTSQDVFNGTNSEITIAIRKGLSDANEYLANIGAIASLGAIYKHLDSGNAYDTFVSLQPMFKTDTDSNQKCLVSVTDKGTIKLVDKLERNTRLIWKLSVLDYRNVRVDNVEIGTFDTIEHTRTTLYLLLDYKEQSITFVNISFTDSTVTRKPNNKQQAILSNVGSEHLAVLASNMYRAFANMVKNGQAHEISKSKARVMTTDNPRYNHIYSAYRKAQSDKLSRI